MSAGAGSSVKHAVIDKRGNFLCGGISGRGTHPREHVTCAECKEALKFTAARYPERFGFVDIRPTASERKRAAQDLAADAYGGADD